MLHALISYSRQLLPTTRTCTWLRDQHPDRAGVGIRTPKSRRHRERIMICRSDSRGVSHSVHAVQAIADCSQLCLMAIMDRAFRNNQGAHWRLFCLSESVASEC